VESYQHYEKMRERNGWSKQQRLRRIEQEEECASYQRVGCQCIKQAGGISANRWPRSSDHTRCHNDRKYQDRSDGGG